MTPTFSCQGKLKRNTSMVKYSSWRSGGRVKRLFKPAGVDDLCQFIRRLPDSESILWLGLGSNLLVRDGGYDGTVITISGILNKISLLTKQTILVEAGVPCPKVARYCVARGLAGAEFLVGIPGTIGGALAMNSGSFGGETWDIVTSVETLDRSGTRHIRRRDDFQIGYRTVYTKAEEWFLAAELNLQIDTDRTARKKIRDWLSKRAETQPMGQASCGSVFRNPPNDYAARLIEDCGLKGYHIGDACVSERHSNFIINTGQASATDIERLIDYLQRQVNEKHGVKLIPEVCIVGQLANYKTTLVDVP